jgi:spore coat polysaccharide biosynthesis protein SpsF (cytidylyltransferase family)
MVSKIGWLVFIRAGSQRFPGKCYESIHGRNIFKILSDESKQAHIHSEDLILCTSRVSTNSSLVDQAYRLGHGVIRGDEHKPIMRITENWNRLRQYDYIVRICGDSPLYPFEMAKRAIRHYSFMKPDGLTNTRLRQFPPGFSIEAYKQSSLEAFLSNSTKHVYNEHMSEILNSTEFTAKNLVIDIRTPNPLRFFGHKSYTVDYPSDLRTITELIGSGMHLALKRELQELTFI